MVAVGVVSVPEWSSWFPSTVMQVWWVSALLGRMSQTILGYVTFLVFKGTSYFGMKYMVLVLSILLLTLWAKRPNSLARDLVHISLSGPLMRWQNSCITHVTGFSTAFASKCLIYLAALAYRALLTAGNCWCRWRNGYWWVLGALMVAIFGMRGGAAGASSWCFIFSTLGGVGLSDGIMIGGMFTLGNFGATLGGSPGDCVAVSDDICCSASHSGSIANSTRKRHRVIVRLRGPRDQSLSAPVETAKVGINSWL